MKKTINLSVALIKEEYWKKGKSHGDIGEMCKVSNNAVKEYIFQNGIGKRKNGIRRVKVDIDIGVLNNEYRFKGVHTATLAKKYGVTVEYLRKLLSKHKIYRLFKRKIESIDNNKEIVIWLKKFYWTKKFTIAALAIERGASENEIKNLIYKYGLFRKNKNRRLGTYGEEKYLRKERANRDNSIELDESMELYQKMPKRMSREKAIAYYTDKVQNCYV